MTAPTDRQIEILEYIYEHTLAQGIPPTVREISEWFGLSGVSGVQQHLWLCEKKGLTERRRNGVARGWRLTSDGLAAIGARPVVAVVAEARAILRCV